MNAPFNLYPSRVEINSTDFNITVTNQNTEAAYLTGAFITWPTWPGMTFDAARFNGNTFYNPDPNLTISPVTTNSTSILLDGSGSSGAFRARYSGSVNTNGVFGARLTFNIPSLGSCYIEGTYPAPATLTPTFTDTPSLTPSSTSTP
jgi:hypothetical protein